MMRWMPLVEAWMADGSLSQRLCLTLGHSLWQFGLMALAVWAIETLGRRLAFATRYSLCVMLFAVGLVAIPLTWTALPPVELEQPQATAVRASEIAQTVNTPGVDSGAQTAALRQPPSLPQSAPAAETPLASPAAATGESHWPLVPSSRRIAVLYALGVALMLGRLVRGVWKCQRVMRAALPIDDNGLLASLRSIASGWKLRSLPRLAAAGEMAMPCVMGLLRPTIIFPLAALNSLSPVELEMILAHELAHIRRRDLWVHLAQRLAEAVLFFNPGLWYVSRRISLLREVCCDELACERNASDEITARICYAQALLRLVEVQFVQLNGSNAERLSALAAAGDSPSQLRRRISVLLGEPVRQPLLISRAGAMTLAVAIAALFVVPTVVVSNDEPADREPPPAGRTATLPDAAPEAARHPGDERFVKRHSCGVEVKLLAIGTRGEPVQRWWRPDGSLLDGEPYYTKDFERYNFPGPLTREVVFSMENLPEGARWKCRTRPSSTHINSGGVADSAGNRLRYHHAHITSLADNGDLFGFDVGVAAGEWGTVATLDLPAHTSTRVQGDVVFAGPFLSPVGRSLLTVSHNLQGQVRLVAVHKGGYRSPQLEGPTTGADAKLKVSQFELGSGIDRIARVEFQTRPFEWIAFDDLPAQPREGVSDSALDAAPTVTVLAIGYGDAAPAGKPSWWDLDGTPRDAPSTRFNGRRNPRMMSDPRARQVVWELPRYRAGTAVRYEIRSKNGWTRGELTNGELDQVAGQGKIMHELHAIDPDAKSFTLKVGVAEGPWKTVFSGQAGAVAQGNNELKGVVFSDAFAQGDGSAVVVSHNLHGQNARLVAIDKSGKRHTGKFLSHLTAVETVNQTIFAFDHLKPDQFASYEFQVQDFNWTTIDNLPANPQPPADAKATISGRIKLADGAPATQKGWLYTLHRGSNGNSSMVTKGSFTDRYTFDVPSGKLWFTYFTDDFAPVTAGPFELKPEEKLQDFDLVLRPGVTWHLKFQNEDGDAVVATANAVPFLGDGLSGPVKPLTANESGELSLEHLTQNVAYQLSVRASGHQPMVVNLPTNTVPPNSIDSPVAITMRKARPATGVVRLSNGEPARGAKLTVRAAVTPASGIAHTRAAVPVDEEGRFSIDELADGTYYLVMGEAADGARVMLPPVVAGQSDVEVKIPPRRDLKVHVVGDLDKLENRKSEPAIHIGQRYTMRTPSGGPSYGDYLGETVAVSATDDGGVAVYRGLIDAPIVINVGKREYEFDASETEVTIRLDDALHPSRY